MQLGSNEGFFRSLFAHLAQEVLLVFGYVMRQSGLLKCSIVKARSSIDHVVSTQEQAVIRG
jgi:hypothetical protein